MDDVKFGRNGREADTCSDCHEGFGDTGTECDVYECLLELSTFCLNNLVGD